MTGQGIGQQQNKWDAGPWSRESCAGMAAE